MRASLSIIKTLLVPYVCLGFGTIFYQGLPCRLFVYGISRYRAWEVTWTLGRGRSISPKRYEGHMFIVLSAQRPYV